METNAGNINKYWIDNIITYNPSEKYYWRGWIATYEHDISKGSTPAEKQASIDAYERDMAYLKSREDQVWVGLYTDIAKYGQERDTHTLKVTQAEAGLIKFTLSDSMVDEIYTYPLTVKVRLNPDWEGVRALQNGKEIEAAMVTYQGAKYALVKAVPDQGEVELMQGVFTGFTLDKHYGNYNRNTSNNAAGLLYSITGTPLKTVNFNARGLCNGMYLLHTGGQKGLKKVMYVK
jgi:hypothetical protein